eukprot:TRINITY_DN2003_c0_g1_i1.p2 TRINITY_DN2003_c0_g1~~TRINITY_DN2003_c0_g1_i1.p2  ORF type:complete len:418 (+),score=150.63 TRINITY_DN2003_c0_g1_i1:1302-2555(+)
MNLIDLAGSESGEAHKNSKSSSSKHEMLNINRSLLTLTTVISKLSEKSTQWIPYRDSKLTKYMENALQGNAKIAIVCNIAPGEQSYDQSQSTLSFASMAKKIKQTVQKNEAPNDDKTMVIIRLESEIKMLKEKLRAMEESRAVTKPVEEDEVAKTKDKLIRLASKITTGAVLQKSTQKEQLPANFQVRVSQITEALSRQSKIDELRMSTVMQALAKCSEAKANPPFQIFEDREGEDKADQANEDDVIDDDEFEDAREEFDRSSMGLSKEESKLSSTRHSTNIDVRETFDGSLFKLEDDAPVALESDLIFPETDLDFLTDDPSVQVPDYLDLRESTAGVQKVDKSELKDILQKAEDVVVEETMDDMRRQLVESDMEKQKLRNENKELTEALSEMTNLLETTLAELKEYRDKYGEVYPH